MKFQLLIKIKMLKIMTSLAFKLSDDSFIMLIKVKMPRIVGIITCMIMIKFVLSWVELKRLTFHSLCILRGRTPLKVDHDSQLHSKIYYFV